jgi:uncharacterized protein (TIGR03437 family)
VKVDGADCATPCDVQRPVGTEVRVTAPVSVPLGEGVRGDFAGWAPGAQAADWTVKLGGDPVALTASYRTMNRLLAVSDPPDGAAWKMQPASPDGFYDADATVGVTVSALPGFRFRGWSGDLRGGDPAGVVSMSAPRQICALLDRVPYIGPAAVQNGAGVTPQAAVAAGSAVSVFGASLAPATEVGPDSPLAQTLAGVTVRLGDRLLPLYFVSDSQINLELPPDLPDGKHTLAVSLPGQADVTADFTVARNAPGLFQQAVNGQSLAVALHEDGSLVTPDSPAKKGELLTLYGTGFGPTDRPRPEGLAIPASPPYPLSDKVSVVVADTAIDAEKAFAAPGRVGVDVVQFRLGSGTPAGQGATLLVRISGQESNTVVLPVQ